MSLSENNQPPNKLLMAALFASFLAIVGTAGILYYLGVFSNVSVTKTMSPTYHLAYLSHTGAYNKIQGVFNEAESALERSSIKPIARAALFLDDSSLIPEENQRSKIGFLINANDPVPAGLVEEKILSREVVIATFDGSPVIGSYKAYSALKQWCVANGFKPRLPALEIYYDDGVVEYQLPVTRD